MDKPDFVDDNDFENDDYENNDIDDEQEDFNEDEDFDDTESEILDITDIANNIVENKYIGQLGGINEVYNASDYDSDEYNENDEDVDKTKYYPNTNDDDNINNNQMGGENSDDDNYEDNDDDEDDEDENYLKKFENNLNKNYIKEYHPECIIQNYDEVLALANVVRDNNGIIIDDLHKTIPYLTKYEKTKIIGFRANQINNGAKPYINIPNDLIDGYLIAIEELKQKKIPFIIRRPLVGSKMEFWKLSDLEQIDF